MKIPSLPLLISPLLFCSPAFASVAVTSPTNGQTVSTSVYYLATGSTSTCSSGVASMGVYVDDNLIYVVSGASVNTTLQLAVGGHNTVVEEWDYCGGATYTSLQITVSEQYGVTVTTPQNNGYVSYLTNFTASAVSSCPSGVASMGVYVNNELKYVQQGSNLTTVLDLPAGYQQTVVEEWDKCGGASYTPVNVTVLGTTLSSLQASEGWEGYGELAPLYAICSECSGVTWSMVQQIGSPSLSGDATQFNIGGTVPYSDVLWTNPILGQNTTQNIPDSSHTLLPTLHNFTYDAYVYPTNFSITQNLEFDINMYMNGVGLLWGTQCDHLADGDWDIWNDPAGAWISTGVPCNLTTNAWNHITIQGQRESNNDILYQWISVNGVTFNLNQTVAPYSVPSGWWGMTVNFQMDGNYDQAANTVYLDDLSFTYW
jgi:hypothetical protein